MRILVDNLGIPLAFFSCTVLPKVLQTMVCLYAQSDEVCERNILIS